MRDAATIAEMVAYLDGRPPTPEDYRAARREAAASRRAEQAAARARDAR